MTGGEEQGSGEEAAAEAAAGAAACGNCGAALEGRYCHRCGARDVAAKDLSLRRFAAEAVEEVTNLQHSKILRTLWALLFRPGLLSLEYFSARRIRYIKPLPLTLAVLALHLFTYSVSSSSSMYDIGRMATVQQEMQDTFPVKRDLLIGVRLERMAFKRGISVDAVEQEINDDWVRNQSLLQIPLILFLALALQLFHIVARRYFVEHLVFSMHLISFTGLTVVMMWPLYYLLGANAGAATGTAGLLAVGKFLVDGVWIVLATRLFYRYSLLRSVLITVPVYIGYYAVFSGFHQLAMYTAMGAAAG